MINEEELVNFNFKLRPEIVEAIMALAEATSEETTVSDIFSQALGHYLLTYVNWKDGKKMAFVNEEQEAELVKLPFTKQVESEAIDLIVKSNNEQKN